MKIKLLMITAVATILTATGAKADDWWNTHMSYDTGHQQLYNPNELSLDLFGTFLASERHFLAFPNTGIRSGTFGGGAGVNYFFTRMLGIGADTSFQSRSVRFTDHVGGNLFFRIPIESIRLAPYVFGGGGRAFSPDWRWFEDVGVGLEFRINPKLGLFGDARYIWKQEGASDQALIRTGIRVIF